MLEEWRPLLCPFDVTVIRGLSYYEVFLPTNLPPEKHHMGFKYALPTENDGFLICLVFKLETTVY